MIDKEFESVEIFKEKINEKNKNFQFSKNIKFQNVSFTYDNKKFIFKNFSGHFLKNKIIGISGINFKAETA